MATQIVFPHAHYQFLSDNVPDLSTEVEVMLLMTNNNAADTPAAENLTDLTLDEIGGGAARVDAYLIPEADYANRRNKLKPVASDLTTPVTVYTFPDLAAGARNVAGLLWATKSTHPTHPSMPIAYRAMAASLAANGADFEMTVGPILFTSPGT